MTLVPPAPRAARRAAVLLCAVAGASTTVATTQAGAAVVPTTAAGATPAAIQTAVDGFRTTLGANNGAGGTPVAGGRREINWDGVPDTFASPNAFPAGFFNANSPRGVLFSTPGTGFRVSADDSNPTVTPVRFAELDASYGALFSTFSAQRLFTPIGSTVTDVAFFVPGTSTPATTNAFGAVFTDVDTAGAAKLEAFDADGQLVTTVAAPVSPDHGLSFAAFHTDAGERVTRVRITAGTKALGVPEAGADDLVAIDDVLYGEPQAATRRPDPAPVVVPGPAPDPVVVTQAGPPATPAAPAPDKAAPRLSLLGLSAFRAVLGSSESCTYTATLKLDARTAKRLGLKATLATHGRTACVAGATVVVSKLKAGTVGKLRAAKARPVLKVTAADAAGNTRSVSLKLR